MKIILSLLIIALPSVGYAFEYEKILVPPSNKMVFNPNSLENDSDAIGNRVPNMKELKELYLDRMETNLRSRMSDKTYIGLATVGHASFQTFNYFNSEAKASVKINSTRLTLRVGRNKPAKFEIRRDFKLDNNSMFESGSISGYISQKGNLHVGFRFKF